jgi:hypothetical protein
LYRRDPLASKLYSSSVLRVERSALNPAYTLSRRNQHNSASRSAPTPCALWIPPALDHQADITKVQERLGHANIATTRIYDHRTTRPEDSPTFKVNH